jgi:hypothetical protein
MTAQAEIVSEMNRLVDAAQASHIKMRVIGGLAVNFHSQNNQRTFRREYPDIDFVVQKSERRKLGSFFQNLGYLPDKQFNLLNGGRRQIFYEPESGLRIDVFLGDFEMCHKLPMKNRLELNPVTVPLAELLLSKTQIVELNHKDALDIIALLLNNELGRDDRAQINLHRIVRLCMRDWGLYKTTSINLRRVEDLLLTEDLGLADDDNQLVVNRIHHIQRTLEAMSKPLFWKIRNQLGTRIRWYAEVEEVVR